MKKQLLFALSVLCFTAATAQSVLATKFCGTPEVMEKAFRENPKLKAEFEAREEQLRKQDAADFLRGYPNTQTPLANNYVIPVVFHVIHNYGLENISDAQIKDEVRILNLDYNKLNADTSAVDSVFKPLIANVGITFKLAQLDPNGKCTNGIDRIPSLLTYNADDNAKLNPWPNNQYLNVWVVSSIANGAAGYAYYPSGFLNPSVDGVLILSSYIGSIGTSQPLTSRALSHEIGHVMNLEHPWGNTNAPGVACGDDAVSDTPVTEGWNHCPGTPASAMICTPGVEENYQNFMDYSYCSHMFTIGQANRIYAALGSTTAGRNNLWSASNLAATGLSSNPVVCAPLADFTPATPTLLCAGSTAQYKYLLMNGQPSTWSWTFPGGTPSVSTDSFPLIQYNTPGTYSVTLTVSNANGSNSRTRTGLVIVSPTTAQYATTSYSEGFENSATVGADWIFLAPYGNPWARTTTAAATGTASLKLKNSTDLKGEVTTAISPSIDFAGIPSPALTFKVAFALKATGNADRLTVGFSADCGKTWLLRYFKSGSALATAPVTTGSFVPTSAQWRLETISMSAVNTYSNARVKFEMLTDAGNDIYVDDINVASSFNGILEEAAGVNNLLLYPNPASETANIEFSLVAAKHVIISVRNMVGQDVLLVADQHLEAGEHKFTFAASDKLPAGMYFVTLLVGNQLLSQKMMVR